jgi:uncharacterized RDD family membrane protein YckC
MNSAPELASNAQDWRLYDGVLSRRVLAFVADYLIVLVLCIPASVFLILFSIATLGLGLFLFPALFFIVAALYFGLSVGGRLQSTPGMRMAGIVVRRIDGRPMDFMTAVVHLVLFWILNAVLSPLILLAGLFIERSRLVHDLLIGTEAVRADL